MNKINFLQKKYVLPLIALPFLIFIAYMINQFKPTKELSNLVEVEELNAQLQDPTSSPTPSNNTTGGKLNALKQRLKREGDFTGIQNVETEIVQDEMVQNSSSLYTTEEMRAIDSINQVNAIRAEELRRGIDRYRSQDFTKEDPAISQAPPVTNDPFAQQNPDGEQLSPEEIQRRKIEEQMRRLDSITEARSIKVGQNAKKEVEETTAEMIENPELQTNRYQEQVAEVKRSKDVNNAYFNTVGNYDYNLGISAILDEGLKVVHGSRVRIRLLEEATIGEFRLQPGEYLYGIVSGFSAQRVKINITSIMLNGTPTKVNLSVYDIDGMEGFYIPQSAFRDAAKEAGSKASQQNINVNSGVGSGIAQFTYKMLQDLYQSSTQAISKNIRQNKAKLKYATQVFLVNKDEQ